MTSEVTSIASARKRKQRDKVPAGGFIAAVPDEPAQEPPAPKAAAPLMLDRQDDRLKARSLPLSTIVPAPHNARVETDPEKQKELIASVKEHGILQPVLVRPMDDGTYELVAGWRRWTAAKASTST